MPTIENQDLFILTFNNMDSVRKLDMSLLKRVMTDVIPYEDHQPTTLSISIDTIHTKSFHIKLTIAKGSIYFCLCYEEYVKSSRHSPTSNFIEFKASNTVSVNVPNLQNLGISSMLFATESKKDQMSNYVSRSLFISTELPLVSKLLTSANSSCFS